MQDFSIFESLIVVIDRKFNYVKQFNIDNKYEHREWLLEIFDIYKLLLEVEHTRDICKEVSLPEL